MKKPEAAIERMRGWTIVPGIAWPTITDDMKAILAYLGSLKPWPADLTRERLEDIARNGGWNKCTDIILRLAELAPVREKRRVSLWQHEAAVSLHVFADGNDPNGKGPSQPWRKVGGPFEIEE